jgi:hypothetical protein
VAAAIISTISTSAPRPKGRYLRVIEGRFDRRDRLGVVRRPADLGAVEGRHLLAGLGTWLVVVRKQRIRMDVVVDVHMVYSLSICS